MKKMVDGFEEVVVLVMEVVVVMMTIT